MEGTETGRGRGSEHYPYPPFELANRVASLPSDDLQGYINYEMFGRLLRSELLRILPDDYALGGRRLLDFGCGAGRTLRHFMAEAEQGEVWGVDIDAPSIDWMEEHLCPPLKVLRAEPAPPLPFEPGSFDLIWAISVFTHLTDQSLPWLAELHRILDVGGLLVASYMGEWNSEVTAGEQWDPDSIGFNVLQHDRPWDAGGPMALMSDWWVREHWGRAFEFSGVTAPVFKQTWVLLRKRDVEISAEDLAAPSDDPREIDALRHNVAQLQAEIERSNQRVRAMERFESELRRSRGWRLLEGLRRIRGREG
jgi:SAM-dependent methyltransferase